MNRENFDVRSFIARQPIDKELFRYEKSLYPANKLGISEKFGSVYTYILDWHKAKYSFLSDGIKKLVGYEEDFLETGLEGFFQVIHPEDHQPLQRIIAKWMEVLLGKSEVEFNRYTANFNFRIRKSNGAYVNLLQQPVYVSFDKLGNLIYEAGFLTDITRYKNDGNISLLILDPDQVPLLEYYPKEDFMPRIGSLRQKTFDLERISVSTENGWYRNFQKIIYDNIDNQMLDVDLICTELNISRSNLYRKITRVSESKPGSLIKIYRLIEALGLLSTQDYSVSEVAWKTGFKSHSYFSNCFREQFGCAPSQYRVQVK